jgi:hypothetical protein
MIVKHACAAVFVHHAYLARMSRKSMAAVVVFFVVCMRVCPSVIYVGFRTISNEKIFEKNIVYKKIQIVVIVRRHVVVAHVLYVKRLVFLSAEVYLKFELN